MSENNKVHLDREELLRIVQEVGAEYEQLSKYYRVGPKKGPHLMVSRAKKVTLIYGYGLNEDIPGVTNYSEEQRKEQKLGGISLQLDLSVGRETATEAFRRLVERVKGV